jgi:chemotaxis protein MotB
MRRARRGGAEALNPWAGYVDALSTLLMVIIFVLLVFVLAQAFLSAALSGRTQALDSLHARMDTVAGALAAEQGRNAALRASVAQQAAALRAATAERDDLDQQLALLRAETARIGAERDGLRDERDRLAARLTDQGVQAQAAAARLQALQGQLEAAEQAQRGGALDLQAARDQAARLIEETAALRDQSTRAGLALDAAQAAARGKDQTIAALSQRLDVALARKVEELQSYRSEFFGKLRQVLANRPGVQVVGDRFVFQSEVLFPPGGSNLDPGGVEQIAKLAATLRDIAARIPADVNWILRVDGHADRQPMAHQTGFDNWNLSALRAINVVRQLIADGIPPNHLAAAAFGDNQPLDPADTPAAYTRNRRIEIRLTDR